MGSRRNYAPLAVAAAPLLALLAAGCGAPPGPEGWAAPNPVTVQSQQVILVAHKSHLYALPEGSSNANWQFPPKDKSTYPVSEEAQQALSSAVDALDTDEATRTQLKQKVRDLTLTGPSAGALKDAVKASSAPDNKKSDLTSAVDRIIKVEKDALGKLQAIYGDIGVSSDSGTVFVATFRGIVFALDIQTGHARWLRDTGGELVGGVAVDGGVIYVGNKAERVLAYDAASGAAKWSFDADGAIWATPTVSGDVVYVTSLDGSLYQLDKASGHKNWAFSGAQSGIASRPVVDGSSVYVGAFDNRMYSINTADGSMNWSLKADNWFWATPVVRGGVVYAASLDGKVYAVDAASGGRKWAFDTGSPVRAAPVIAGDGLVVASKDGHINKLDLETGEPAEGSPRSIGTKILSDLVNGAGSLVYISPAAATLVEFDASAVPLEQPGGTPLPQ